MRNKRKWPVFFYFGLAGSAVLSGCGSSSSSPLSVGLNSIPSADQMAATSTNTGIVSDYLSGTPPKIHDLSASNADQYFWNGLVGTIHGEALSSLTHDQEMQFWGNVPGGPGAMGACQMAQAVAQNFDNILNASNSTCYMKGMSGISGQPALFDQSSGDQKVLVHVTNMSNGGGGPSTMDVHITVFGTNSVGSDVYKVQLYMCAAGSVTQNEIITVNKNTGAYTDVSDNSQGTGNYSTFNLSANLISDGAGGLKFDLTKDRIAQVAAQYSSQVFSGYIDISGGQMTAKMYNTGSWGTNKIYAVLDFTGSSLADLAFTEGAFANINANGSFTSNYTAGTTFTDTFYTAVASSDLLTAVNAYSFGGDSFWGTTSVSAPDYTGLDCTDTSGTAVPMDFSTSAVAALQQTCEGDHRSDGGDICFSQAVQDDQMTIWQNPK